MTGTRRFSQAISEGDGISVIVEVDGPEAARDAQDAGAEALFLRTGHESSLPAVRAASELPILVRHDAAAAARVEGADALLVDLGEANADSIDDVRRSLTDACELAPRIGSDDDLEYLLDELDPEILVLAPATGNGGDDSPLERVLDLLGDVPAGKLVVADIGARTREEIEELERAGIDGVIVATGNVAHLVGAAPPEV